MKISSIWIFLPFSAVILAIPSSKAVHTSRYMVKEKKTVGLYCFGLLCKQRICTGDIMGYNGKHSLQ